PPPAHVRRPGQDGVVTEATSRAVSVRAKANPRRSPVPGPDRTRLAATGNRGAPKAAEVDVAGRIGDEDIAAVRERSPIDEVIGEYLQLKNAGGGSLKGLCPFHDEKTPSFNVTPARGLFYCFSCAEGGDAIKF